MPFVGCRIAHSSDIVRYPHYAVRVAKAVSNGEAQRGILICSTGIGMSIIANKFERVRAALCTSTYMGRLTRAHNDSNILCAWAGRSPASSKRLTSWRPGSSTDYEGGRHDISLGLIAEAEENLSEDSAWEPSDEYFHNL